MTPSGAKQRNNIFVTLFFELFVIHNFTVPLVAIFFAYSASSSSAFVGETTVNPLAVAI
jgi:uncharacterized membrane protein